MLNLAGFGLAAWNDDLHDAHLPLTFHSTNVAVFDANLRALAARLKVRSLVAQREMQKVTREARKLAEQAARFEVAQGLFERGDARPGFGGGVLVAELVGEVDQRAHVVAATAQRFPVVDGALQAALLFEHLLGRRLIGPELRERGLTIEVFGTLSLLLYLKDAPEVPGHGRPAGTTGRGCRRTWRTPRPALWPAQRKARRLSARSKAGQSTPQPTTPARSMSPRA
jgi:hypothetical protein